MPEEKETRTEFDYETAWREAAEPAFRRLPAEVVALYELTREVAKDLGQNTDCSMVWPEDGGEHKKRFDALDDATLALASRVVHNYGHWAPGETDRTGGTWKFAKYCDQVLASRLGAALAYRSGNGAHCRVDDGALHVSVNTPWSGGGGEPLPATREAYAEIKAAIEALKEPEPRANREMWEKWEKWEDAVNLAIKRVAARHVQSAEFAALDSSRFMVSQGTWERRREAERRAKADVNAEPRFDAIVRAVRSLRESFGDDTKSIEGMLFQLFLQLRVSGGFRDRVMLAAGEGTGLNDTSKKVLDR